MFAVDASQSLLTVQEFSRLRWRCRRGLLENDLFMAGYLERYGSQLTVEQARAVYALMDLSDNELLDLLLRRVQLPDTLAQVPQVPAVLAAIQACRPQPAS